MTDDRPALTPGDQTSPARGFGGTRGRFIAVASVVAIAAVVALAASRNASPTGSAPRPSQPTVAIDNCYKDKDPIAVPSWYPADLPMPQDSYAIDVPEAASGLRRVVFSAKGTLRDFVIHALGVWPDKGWTLGRGESEPGEAEDNFLMGDRYGIFRAQSIMCDTGRTWVLMVLNDPSVKNVPTPGFNRHDPNVTPSPLKP